jgi:hypothetical protein
MDVNIVKFVLYKQENDIHLLKPATRPDHRFLANGTVQETGDFKQLKSKSLGARWVNRNL